MMFWLWLQFEMRCAKVSNVRLAKSSGLSVTSISHYKTGLYVPSVKSLHWLCDGLASLQNKSNSWKLSKSEVRLLSDKMIIEATRIM